MHENQHSKALTTLIVISLQQKHPGLATSLTCYDALLYVFWDMLAPPAGSFRLEKFPRSSLWRANTTEGNVPSVSVDV